MKYKLISMDFDGTLLSSDKKVSDINKDILLKYKNDNYIIVGITARNFSSVKSVCDINMFNYLILNNGAYIYDLSLKKENNLYELETNTIKDITSFFEEISDLIQYCGFKNYYTYKKETTDKRSFIKKVNKISEIKEIICRMNIFLKNDDEINKYKDFIEKTYKNIKVFIMSDTDNKNSKKWLSINPKDMNKFETLKKLCFELGISTEDVIFFGDGANDIPIISRVGLGIAMENALDDVKKCAKEITLSNNDNGIAYWLEKNK